MPLRAARRRRRRCGGWRVEGWSPAICAEVACDTNRDAASRSLTAALIGGVASVTSRQQLAPTPGSLPVIRLGVIGVPRNANSHLLAHPMGQVAGATRNRTPPLACPSEPGRRVKRFPALRLARNGPTSRENYRVIPAVEKGDSCPGGDSRIGLRRILSARERDSQGVTPQWAGRSRSPVLTFRRQS